MKVPGNFWREGFWREGLIVKSGGKINQKVAKPLLSMGTVGSMDCERRAKPLKHTILTSKQNKMHDLTGVALLRGYVNLHHIMNAKKLLGKNIYESLVPR